MSIAPVNAAVSWHVFSMRIPKGTFPDTPKDREREIHELFDGLMEVFCLPSLGGSERSHLPRRFRMGDIVLPAEVRGRMRSGVLVPPTKFDRHFYAVRFEHGVPQVVSGSWKALGDALDG